MMKAISEKKSSSSIAKISPELFKHIVFYLDIKSMHMARFAFSQVIYRNILTNAMLQQRECFIYDNYKEHLIFRAINLKDSVKITNLWKAFINGKISYFGKIKIILEVVKATHIEIPHAIQEEMIHLAKCLIRSQNDFRNTKNTAGVLFGLIAYLDKIERKKFLNAILKTIFERFSTNDSEIYFLKSVVIIFPEALDDCFSHLTRKILNNSGDVVFLHLLRVLMSLSVLFPQKRVIFFKILTQDLIEKNLDIYMYTKEIISAIKTLSIITQDAIETAFNCLIRKITHESSSVRDEVFNSLMALLPHLPEKENIIVTSYKDLMSNLFSEASSVCHLNYYGNVDLLCQLTFKYTEEFLEVFRRNVYSNLYEFSIFLKNKKNNEFPEVLLKMIEIVFLNYFDKLVFDHVTMEIYKSIVCIAENFPELSFRCFEIIKNHYNFSFYYSNVSHYAFLAFLKLKKMSAISEDACISYVERISFYRDLNFLKKMLNESDENSESICNYIFLVLQLALLSSEDRRDCLLRIMEVFRNYDWDSTEGNLKYTLFSLKGRALALNTLVELSPFSDDEKLLINFDEILEENRPYYEISFFNEIGEFVYSKPPGNQENYERDIFQPITRFMLAFPEKLDACWNSLINTYVYSNLGRYFTELLTTLNKISTHFPVKRRDFFNFLIRSLAHENMDIFKKTLSFLNYFNDSCYVIGESEWILAKEKLMLIDDQFQNNRRNGILFLINSAIKMKDEVKIAACAQWNFFIYDSLGEKQIRELFFSIREVSPGLLRDFFGYFNARGFSAENKAEVCLEVYSDHGIDPVFRIDPVIIHDPTIQLSVKLLNSLFEMLVPTLSLSIQGVSDYIAAFNQSIYNYSNPLNGYFYKNKQIFSEAFNRLIFLLNAHKTYSPTTFTIMPLQSLFDALVDAKAHFLRNVLHDALSDTVFSKASLEDMTLFKIALNDYAGVLLQKTEAPVTEAEGDGTPSTEAFCRIF